MVRSVLDLSIIRQLLPLLAIFIPQLAPILPIIEKLLDLFGFNAIPSNVIAKFDELLDTVKANQAPAGATPPTP